MNNNLWQSSGSLNLHIGAGIFSSWIPLSSMLKLWISSFNCFIYRSHLLHYPTNTISSLAGWYDTPYLRFLCHALLVVLIALSNLVNLGKRFTHCLSSLIPAGVGRKLSWLEHGVGNPGDRGMNPAHSYSIYQTLPSRPLCHRGCHNGMLCPGNI